MATLLARAFPILVHEEPERNYYRVKGKALPSGRQSLETIWGTF